MIYVGRMMRLARSRSCRAIAIGSASVSTSAAACEQDFVLRRPDLGLDDLDRQVFLLAACEPGGAIPHRRHALVGTHGGTP